MVSVPIGNDDGAYTALTPQKAIANASNVIKITQNSVNFVHFKVSQNVETGEGNGCEGG